MSHQPKIPVQETVILLHGLGRTSLSMLIMARALRREGYRVINLGYPSRTAPIPTLVDKHLRPVAERAADEGTKVHFVTHSLGGILVRYLLLKQCQPHLGRVVMLSPPNQGCEVVDFLAEAKLFQKIMGPAAQQLGTDQDSVPLNLGPVNFDLGVIGGSCAYNPVFSKLLGEKNDGLVSIQRMSVAGMRDFCIVPYAHTFLMNRRKVIRQVILFLKNGQFVAH